MARVADLSGNSPIGSGKDERRGGANNNEHFNDALAVTPSDTVDLVEGARALYVGGAGNLNIDTRQGTTELFTAVAAGTLLKVAAKRVRATSTTATLIKALY